MALPAKKKGRPLINGRFPKPPFWLSSLILIGISASILAFAMIVRARTMMSPNPRIHLIQDMDNQVKVTTQSASTVFEDGRATRPKIPGTVARGQLMEDDHLWHGFTAQFDTKTNAFGAQQFFAGFPKDVKIDESFMKRGQAKFNIYCMPCHGYDGQGNGPVHVRSTALAANSLVSPGMSWVQPSNLTDAERRARPDGHIFNSITNGIRNMGAYGPAIQDPQDRWAIVAYVRALQVNAGAAKPAAAGTAGAGSTTQPVAMN